MAVTSLLQPAPRARPSEHRDRLLATASGIFYAEGIRHVGIDRIISDAGVTKATFYRHFPSKEDLVLAYLAGAHTAIAAGIAQVRERYPEPADALRAIATGLAGEIAGAGFRGCAFVNAGAEYPDPDSGVHQLVLEHRAWFLGVVQELWTLAEVESAERAARHFVMLRDGAMVAGYLADRHEAGDTLINGVEGMIRVVMNGGSRRLAAAASPVSSASSPS